MALTREQFAQQIKRKYPSYQNLDDNVLVDKILSKYPQYNDIITQSNFVEGKASLSFKEKLLGIGEKRGTQFLRAADTEQNILSKGLQATGSVLGGAADVIRAGVGTAYEKLGSPLKEQGIKAVQNIASIPTLGGGTLGENLAYIQQDLEKLKKNKPELGGNIQALLDIADFAATTKLVEGGLDVVSKTEKGVRGLAKKTKQELPILTKKTLTKAEELKGKLGPKQLTPEEASGQILQGKKADIQKGVRVLSKVDTKDVKTFSQLDDVLSNKANKLRTKVDDVLSIDQTKRKLNSFTQKFGSGDDIVMVNPVERALDHLDEVYMKTGYESEALRIRDIKRLANKKGLTSLELNNLAREYGTEFGNKAFSKTTGEALTSVNARLYESTRKSLKEAARQTINGAEAKAADLAMSEILDVKDLIKKNAEAVNKLQQKIAQRSVFETIGVKVAKYANALSGGSIRGVVGGLLPRGAGYKVMNALDLQEVLSKNLKIIQNALESSSESEIIKIIGRMR